MNLTGNTIFITGGGSGIGRGLAEALQERGNQVIISGRRKSHLEAVVKANPGMASIELDLQDPESIASVAKKLIAQYPKLDILINNAGIMQIDDAAGVVDDALLVSTVNTNLLGSIRMTSAFIEHLKKQPAATVIYNTSVLGFVPLAMTAVYSSTKAALHSYVLSQRYKLKNTTVRVIEIAPPWVQTDLLGSNDEPRAMPLAEFIKETVEVLGTGAQEVLVERAKALRNNPGPKEGAFVTRSNLEPEKRDEMSESTAAKNKAIVLEAFETLFNKRDYVAAERYWSPQYIQHSAHIAPGREGLFNLIKSLPPTLKYEHGTILAEGDFVIVHGRYSGALPKSWVVADIVRIKDGVLAEHWDVIQDEASRQESKSGLPMFGEEFTK